MFNKNLIDIIALYERIPSTFLQLAHIPESKCITITLVHYKHLNVDYILKTNTVTVKCDMILGNMKPQKRGLNLEVGKNYSLVHN